VVIRGNGVRSALSEATEKLWDEGWNNLNPEERNLALHGVILSELTTISGLLKDYLTKSDETLIDRIRKVTAIGGSGGLGAAFIWSVLQVANT
jgi:hypothetical protein